LYAVLNSADEVNIDAPLPGELEPHLAKKVAYDKRRRSLVAPQFDQIAAIQRRWELRLLEAATDPGQNYRWDREWEILGLI